MEKIIGIYRFININTLKVYVGASRNVFQRKSGHVRDLTRNKHHSFLLQRSWNKHGENAFKFEIIEIVSDIAKLEAREQYWIDFYDAANPDKGYNRCPIAGSTKNLIPTPETIEKLRKSHLGHKPSLETIEKQRQAMLGKTYPYKARPWRLKQEIRLCLCGCEEKFITVHNDPKQFLNIEHRNKARRKPREVRICLCGCGESFEVIFTSPKRYIPNHANKVREYTIENPHPMQGKKHTQEALEKMSKVHKGNKHSKETKQKQSESRKKFIVENDLILPHEIRTCVCGCNKSFEIRKTLPNKYLPGHLQILRGMKQVIRTCVCGCKQTFNCFSNSIQASIFGHNLKTRNIVQNLVKEI